MRKKLLYIMLLCLLAGVLFYLYFSYIRIYSLFDKTSNPNIALNYIAGNIRSSRVINYAALGDSLTAGVGASDAQHTFPYLLSEKIAGRGKVQLFNLGQPGATSAEVLQQQIVPLSSFGPEVITLFIGTNDMHQRVSINTFKNNYNQILDDLEKYKKAKVILINLPYLGSGSLILPPWRGYFDNRINKYNQVISEIAAERKLTLIDLYGKTKTYFKDNQNIIYSADLYHPTDVGYAFWADQIYADYR